MSKTNKTSYQDLAKEMKKKNNNGDNKKRDEQEDEITSEAGSLSYPSHAEVEAELAKVEAERDEYKNDYLRALAEMKNLRQRVEKDMTRTRQFALEKFAQELLQVIDSLELGLKIDADNNELAKKIHQGMELTLDLILKTLKKFDIKQINPEGESFNPDWHEAMSTRVVAEVEPDTVVEVIQKGYLLHDRLLRPALVVVARGE